MRILHAGNVANNGYLNAKLMRRAGVEADALCDEQHALSTPEWEDAPPERPSSWERPRWVITPTENVAEANESWLAERARLAAAAPRLLRRFRELQLAYEPLREVLDSDLRFADVVRAWTWLRRLGRAVEPLEALFRRYDVVQANGLHPILALLAAPAQPWVAFEHGTMRDLPFGGDWRGRLLSLAYRQAAHVVITNADVVAAARRLGVERCTFVPHPIDETKYTPGASGFRETLGLKDELILFSPSSQNWDIKGNDRALRGFAQLVRADRPDAVLVLTEWGLELDRSRALVGELGIGANVRWLPPQPKPLMIDAYRGADIVLDQFLIGTFGAVAPEAMACGTAVIMAFDPAIHEWCFAEQPPVVSAREPDEVYRELRRLGEDAEERARLGRAGRAWIERHHGWQLVVDRYLSLYEEVLR